MIASARRFCEPLKMWKPTNSSGSAPMSREHLRHALGIDAELLRSAAHLHARGLQLEIGIDAHGDARPHAAARARARRAAHLALGLDVDRRCRRRRRARAPHRVLPGPGEADRRPVQCRLASATSQLADGGDVEAVDQAAHVSHDRRHRIRLDRVVQMRRRRAAPRAAPATLRVMTRAVVGIERRAADLRRDRR